MKAQYSKEQILKFIESLPESEYNEIREKMNKVKNIDFAQAYGFDPKQFTRSEIELGFGQVI